MVLTQRVRERARGRETGHMARKEAQSLGSISQNRDRSRVVEPLPDVVQMCG